MGDASGGGRLTRLRIQKYVRVMANHKLGPELQANIAALEELVEGLKTKSLANKARGRR